MKVLHLTSGNLFGGIETYLLTLARLRHLCPSMEPYFGLCFPGRLRGELTTTGVPIYDLGPVRVSRPWTVLKARHRLKRILRGTAFDAVITHGTWPHGVFAPAVKHAGVRLLNAVHDYLDRKHWINRWAARTPPDAIVANSNFTAPSARELFPGVNSRVIYLPVAPPDLNQNAARRDIRAELGTAPETVVILQASRLERWKGQSVFLGALGLSKATPGWEAWVAGGSQKAGEGEFLAELKSDAERMGIADRVKFLGQRADVPRLMAAADVYCQPNTGPEPFGIAFVEALYSGLPVVSSNFGGALEIVDDTCGQLCPPGDVAAVAAALLGMIAYAGSRRSLGEAGPVRAAALCDPSRQLAALEEMASGGGG